MSECIVAKRNRTISSSLHGMNKPSARRIPAFDINAMSGFGSFALVLIQLAFFLPLSHVIPLCMPCCNMQQYIYTRISRLQSQKIHKNLIYLFVYMYLCIYFIMDLYTRACQLKIRAVGIRSLVYCLAGIRSRRRRHHR